MPAWLTFALEHVGAIETVGESVIAFFEKAKAEIDGSDSPADKALAIINDIADNAPAIADAVTANTPAATPAA